MNLLQFSLQFISNILALLQKVLRVVGTFKCPLNIVNFQSRSVLASMQKNWSLFVKNLCFFELFMHVKLLSKFEPSPGLAAVHKQYTGFTSKNAQSCWYL